MTRLFAEQALLPDGWSRSVLVEIGLDDVRVGQVAGAFAMQRIVDEHLHRVIDQVHILGEVMPRTNNQANVGATVRS